MQKIAQVTALRSESAVVTLRKHAACGDCGACQLGEENMETQIDVLNPINAKVGDFVEIEMADGDILMAAFSVYVLPLIALIGGIAISQLCLHLFLSKATSEIISAFFGFIAMAIVYILIRRKYNRPNQKKRYVSQITRILDENSDNTRRL